jgi:hypothetical protein
MSTATLRSAELAAEDWQLGNEDGSKPASLIVQLRRRVHVLPCFRFAYAAGDNSQVQIAFASHMVTVTGHGLAALLAPLATHRVVASSSPPRTKRSSASAAAVRTATTAPASRTSRLNNSSKRSRRCIAHHRKTDQTQAEHI